MPRPNQSACLHQMFDEQARRTPDGIALRDPRGAISYSDLNARAGRVAGLLASRGIGTGGFIGVHMERSIEYVVALLGVLRSNNAVVPLPPAYPEERVREILAHSALDAILVDDGARSGPLTGQQVIRVGEAVTVAGASAPAGPGPVDQPAFVLCSSGSTGKPKMIVRSHRSFLHRLQWTWAQHPFEAGEVCCQKSAMTTTHAIYELFEPLLRGAPAWIVAEQEVKDLARFWVSVADRRISRLLLVPSMLQASLDMPGFIAPPLKVLVLMGEHVPSGLVERTLGAFPAPARLYSIYGSTEASSTLVTDLRDSFRPGQELPLGRPIAPDIHAWVLDAGLDPVAPGGIGMLYLAGPAVFSGYFRAPELTATMFATMPDGWQGFRTQDQVRRLPGDELEFTGRMDQTVKIRGFRVDLHEVESALQRHPAVRQGAVVVDDRDPLAPALLAFVVPDTVAPAEVYQALRSRLPDYMLPAAILAVDALPLTPSGKVDRVALREHHVARGRAGATVQFRTGTEQQVAAAWSGVLGHTDIRPESSFFEVGGTSLKVFAAAHRLRTAFGLDRTQLDDLTIYRFPTVSALAARIDALRSGSAADPRASDAILVSLRQGSDASLPPCFVIASAGGTLGAYEKLVRLLETRRSVIGVRDPFLWGDRDPTLGFRHWVGRYLEAIRERQPQGPYHLVAFSSAGAFGYEIARRLRQAGEEVGLLALIDPLAMDRGSRRRFGYWALEARFMRRPLDRLVRAAGPIWGAMPARWRGDGGLEFEAGMTTEEFDRFSAEVRHDREHILGLSALLELNTGTPFALDPEELSGVAPEAYLGILLARVARVAPDVDPAAITRIVVQYQLQVRAQHAYRLDRLDAPVVLFDAEGRYAGLLEAQLRPYVGQLRVRLLALGRPSGRTEALATRFPGSLRSHFLSMRDEVFVQALAEELGALLR